MVGILIRMRLAILRNSLRGARLVLVVAGALLGLVAAGETIAVAGGWYPPADTPASTDVGAALLAVWTVGWIVGPVFVAGGDETVRPEHLQLLPLRPRGLALGLLVSAAASVTAAVSLLAFGALAVRGAHLGGLPALVGLVGTVLQLALAMLLSRVVISALGGLFRSRRGKDLAMVLSAGVGVLIVPAWYALASTGMAVLGQQLPGAVSTVVRVLPTGWGSLAVESASAGNWLLVLAALAGLALLDGAVFGTWVVLLDRRMTRASSRDVASAQRRSGWSVLPSPASPRTAVLVKELRTWWRDTHRRAALFPMMLLAPAIPLVPAFTTGSVGVQPPVAMVVLLIVFSANSATNLYGFDGLACWHVVAAPDAYRADVRGRQLAWLAIVGPVALAVALAAPPVAGSSSTYPWVLGTGAAMLGTGSGVAVLLSVVAGFAVPKQQRQGNPFATGGFPGCAKVLVQMGGTLLTLLPAVPVLVLGLAGGLTHPLLRWLMPPFGVAIGVVAAWWLGDAAARRLSERGPELLAEVSAIR